MRPQKLFMMTVQTLILRDHYVPISLLGEAAKLPEEAYGNEGDAVGAAASWYGWRLRQADKPAWLEAYEEAARSTVVVRRRRWATDAASVKVWEIAISRARSERDLHFSPELEGVVSDRFDEARVSREEGERFRHWAAAICRELGGVECPFEFEADPPLGAQP